MRGSRDLLLSFRLANEGDVPDLLKLRLAIDADQARRFGNERWSTTINERSVARGLKSSRVLIATRRGRIIGALRMETKKPWAVDLRYFTPVAKAVYLHDVNVNPQLQRTGVGRQLIERAKAVAREWPVDAIRLDAYDGPSGGGPFYKECGFIEVGRAVYRTVPLVYFECVLSSASRDRIQGSAGSLDDGDDQRRRPTSKWSRRACASRRPTAHLAR